MKIGLFFFLSGLFPGVPLLAAEEAVMRLRGELITPPPCVIKDGGKIDVDFGERVGVNKVDGKNYRQRVDYEITCEPNTLRWQMVLTLKGAVGFDKAALQTDNENLNIRVYQNNTPFTINSAINIEPGNLPVLEVVPISKPGAVLSEGAFSATATLQAEYI